MKVVVEFNNTREGYDKVELHTDISMITEDDGCIVLISKIHHTRKRFEKEEVKNVILVYF